jgi:hypothetical protein
MASTEMNFLLGLDMTLINESYAQELRENLKALYDHGTFGERLLILFFFLFFSSSCSSCN